VTKGEQADVTSTHYSTVQYCTVLYCTVLYCTVLCRDHPTLHRGDPSFESSMQRVSGCQEVGPTCE